MARKDKVLRIFGGPIVTMDVDEPVAGEVVLCGGQIVWVGRRGSSPQSYAKARVIDLKGKLLLPAFSDAHTHFRVLAESLGRVDLRGVASLKSALSKVRKHAAGDKSKRGWILGTGFDINLWGNRWPSRHDLDKIDSTRPIALLSHDQHAGWVNSAALRRARYTKDTPDPEGGQIVRDAHGEATGILLEMAVDWIWDQAPELSASVSERLILAAQANAHAVGVAAIGDMGSPVALSRFTSLHEKRKLKLRVWKTIPLAELDHAIALGLRTGLGDSWVKIGGVKIFLDGALGSQTALMYKPYTSDRSKRGISRIEPDQFDRAVAKATKHGLSVCVHAIGDAAVGRAIDTLLKYESRFPRNHPPRIEHLQVSTAADIERLAGHRIVASMQPSHLLTDRDYADQHWGKRARHAFAFRSLWDRGVTLAFGSDAPIEPLSPMDGIGAAVHRARPDDPRGPWYPKERLSVWEAVWGFTSGAAIAAGDGNRRGKIAPGRVADLVALDRDIFSVPPREIFDTKVAMTIVDGDVVFQR